jgi:fructokinase
VSGRTPSVLVVGEALTDVVVTSRGEVTEVPGGSPMNVAVTLGRWGHAIEFHTAIGNDRRGGLIEDHLREAGVALSASSRSQSRTSSAVARLSEHGVAEYTFDISWDPAPLTSSAAGFVHTGSVAAFLEPGCGTVRDLLAVHRPTAVITLDPNVRPSLLSDARTDARKRFEGLLELTDIVKLSDEDAAWLYPGLEPEAVARRLHGFGVRVVALTRGAEGSELSSPGTMVQVAPLVVPVVDTIGAGDAYMGALIAGFIRHGIGAEALRSGTLMSPEMLHEVGTFAAHVAGSTVSRRGADPPWIDHEAGINARARLCGSSAQVAE